MSYYLRLRLQVTCEFCFYLWSEEWNHVRSSVCSTGHSTSGKWTLPGVVQQHQPSQAALLYIPSEHCWNASNSRFFPLIFPQRILRQNTLININLISVSTKNARLHLRSLGGILLYIKGNKQADTWANRGRQKKSTYCSKIQHEWKQSSLNLL